MAAGAGLSTTVPALAAPDSEIGISKAVTAGPTLVSDGTITVQYTIYVTNPADFDVENLQIVDDLQTIFTSPASAVSASVTSSDFTVDFSGLSDTTLLDGTDQLNAGASGEIVVDMVIDPAAQTGPFFNQADLSGQTFCQVGTGTQAGAYQERWDIAGSNNPTNNQPLSTNFTNGLDANGFRDRTTTPTATGNTTAAGADPWNPGEGGTGREIARAAGWVSAPCIAGAASWELRFQLGRAVGTYLGALAVDAIPTTANIITSGGIDGEFQDLAEYQTGNPTFTGPFTATLGLPVGLFMQVDDQGSQFEFRLEERINGGAWSDVPASRIWEDKPTGYEVGGRTLSDVSDSGSNPLPSSDNGSGGTDDPTPVTLPLHSASLDVQKSADNVTNRGLNENIVYTYTVSNNGTVVISNVSLSDSHNAAGPPPSPASETILNDVAPTGDSFNTVGNDGIWDELGPGDSITFTGSYTVRQADIDALQ